MVMNGFTQQSADMAGHSQGVDGVDLASERVGGKVIFATDQWFASSSNLLKPAEPIFIPDKFTSHGKWMDGWETRRKRIPGHDWCIIKLGLPGVVRGFQVDTAFFTGNFAPKISIQGANLESQDIASQAITNDRAEGTAATPAQFEKVAALSSDTWMEIVPVTGKCRTGKSEPLSYFILPLAIATVDMGAGYEETRRNFLKASVTKRLTHIRLNIFPDGGVARFRVYGEVSPDWDSVPSDHLIELSSVLNGAVPIAWSDAHYGHPVNLISPGIAPNMGDGWETKRYAKRPQVLLESKDGFLQDYHRDWVVVRLACPGRIQEVEIDTNHFKGNFPESFTLEGYHGGSMKESRVDEVAWTPILGRSKLGAHKKHHFSGGDILASGPWEYVRLTIIPDGGISRLRIRGYRDVGILNKATLPSKL